MVRKIPKDLKKINGTSKLHHGVNLQRQTWMDTIPLCSECNSFLFYEDIYFECLKCGPEGYKRFVKGGKLFNVVHDNGNSLCLSCLESFHWKNENKNKNNIPSNPKSNEDSQELILAKEINEMEIVSNENNNNNNDIEEVKDESD